MSYRRISLATFAALATAFISTVRDVIVEIAYCAAQFVMMPVLSVCRWIFRGSCRHSISLPKLIAYRIIQRLKPVYRDSEKTKGLNIYLMPMRC